MPGKRTDDRLDVKPFKRTGLHRVACASCGLAVYMTVAQLERGEMPESCWKCGGLFFPENLDLAYAVLPIDVFERHPDFAEYKRQCNRISHGQASHIQRGRQVRPTSLVAASRVHDQRRQDARARQLAGLRQFANQAAAAAEIPF